MSSGSRDGWAARRENQCDDYETGVGSWGNWVICCPSGTTLVLDVDNNTGCSTGKNAPANFPTQCADPSLLLYLDPTGYFCCASGLIGFINKNSWKGCATLNEFNKGREDGTMTRATQSGKSPMSSTVTVTSTPASSPSQTSISTVSPEPSTTSGVSQYSEPQGSTTNTGAIAGGVIGGVFGGFLIAGMIWFVLRRRRPASAASQPDSPNTAYSTSIPRAEAEGHSTQPGGYSNTSREFHNDPTLQELAGSPGARHELPGNNLEAK